MLRMVKCCLCKIEAKVFRKKGTQKMKRKRKPKFSSFLSYENKSLTFQTTQQQA
jgi:hypothetical protein